MKIMTYNLLNYPSPDTNIRNPYLRTVLNSVNPDIIVVCEITATSGVNNFLSNVLNFNGSTYSAGSFINGYDTDNALFYKTSKFDFISNTAIHTQLRDINQFKIADKFYKDTMIIFSVHLKANLSDSLSRAAETDSLRKITNQLPSGTNFIVLGDFNIYSSNESAYKKLVLDNPNDDGNFIDPLTMTGVWNNFAYSQFHTQSTRVRSFGDGATGGLDDRFDMILYSNAVKNSGGIKYITGSLTAYGNDGNHYNDSINQIPNSAVTQTIANALHNASDHLPVYAIFEFGNATVLNVKAIPEGLYSLISNKLNRKDTLNVFLRNINSPYAKADSAKSLIDSNTFYSQAIFRTVNTGSYYLEIKTRNTIETWSKPGGISYYIDSVMNYDFTTSAVQAFGSNLTQKGTKYCIFSGDINQDGIIDLNDMSAADNDSYNFAMGFLITDINGDNFVDIADIAVIENNAYNVVTKITP